MRFELFQSGGASDGKMVYTTENERDAIDKALELCESDFDPVCGGIFIYDNKNKEILTDW